MESLKNLIRRSIRGGIGEKRLQASGRGTRSTIPSGLLLLMFFRVNVK
jgi:hypothetical protein